MKIKFEIDGAKVLAALERAPNAFKKQTRLAFKKQMTKIQRDAKLNHRFQTHSAKLEKSIRTEVDPDGAWGRVYLEEGIAPYGKWVHDGHGSWKPDKFINQAFRKNKANLILALQRATEVGIKKAGL